MKLDSESAYCQQSLVQNPGSKIVECNNIVNDTDILEPGEKLINENQNEAPCDLKGNEKDVNSVSSPMNRDGLWNVSEFDCSTSDDSTNANEDEVRDYGERYNHSSAQIGLYEKDMDLYNAKTVMECELPEIIVCYKESHDNVIKDICIDQGVTSLGKILFGDAVEEDDKNVGLVKGNMDNTMSSLDDSKPSEDRDCCKDSANQCASMDPMQTELSDKDVTKATEETEDLVPELSGNNEDGVNKKSVQIPDEEAMPKNNPFVSVVEESNSSFNKSILSPAPEESNKSPLSDMVCDSKVEGQSVTFNMDSSATAPSLKEESSQNCDFGNLVTQNMSKLEDLVSDHQIVSNQVRHSPGESSFSMAGPGGASFSMAGPGGASFSVTGPLSGLITYSGPIAYSGSCSLRSDSSTTSTRSFAFPVLQNEWNSSPVRMRKADRRKHKGWREGLLCCRF